MEATKLTRADLDQCRALGIQANRAYEEITEYREQAEQTTRHIDGMKVSGGGRHSDRVGDNVADMVDKQREYDRLINAYFCKIWEIKKGLEVITSFTDKMIIELRYIHGLQWQDMTKYTGLSENYCYKRHREILKKLFAKED